MSDTETVYFKAKMFDIKLPETGGNSWALIAASRSGKTTILKYLLKKYYPKHLTVMFTQNGHADTYKDLDGKVIMCDEYHPEVLSDMHYINTECKNKYPFLVVSDDYVDGKIKNDKEITRLLTIYRNANCSSISSFQGRTLMSAVGRNNVNYVLIGRQGTPLEYQNVIKEYLAGYLPTHMTMKECIEFVRKATQDHQFIVIDQLENECYITKLTPSQVSFGEK